MRHRRQDRRQSAASQQVVAAAELLLSGRLIATNGPGARGNGPLAVINALTHSDRQALEELRDQRTAAHRTWSATLTYLAGELLSVAATEDDLIRIQRGTLVPLELQVLAGELPSSMAPAQLSTTVLSALDQDPISRDR